MNICAECNASLTLDDSINHKGKIVCGHCFVKMPKESKVDVKPNELIESVNLIEVMELLVDHDERIKELELRVGVAET